MSFGNFRDEVHLDDPEVEGPTVDSQIPRIEELLADLGAMVSTAKSMPLSSSVLLPREELLSLIDLAISALPTELRDAKWMVRERQEYLDRVKLEADEIIEAARARAESLVSKTDIVRQATSQANHIVQTAREEASKLRLEASDYADQRLASLEIALVNTLKSVRAGRELLAHSSERPRSGSDESQRRAEDVFFDQDH
jgi:cell division septum initiation protein DivIVA